MKSAHPGAAKIRHSASDKAFIVVIYVLGALFLAACAYPLLYILSSSVSNPNLVASGDVWLFPKQLQWDAYKAVFKDQRIWTGYKNTILYAVVGTAINIVMTTIAAYPLSRPDLKGRNVLTFFFTFTMFFGGGMIPTYLLVRDLNLLNSIWAIVLPGAISVYNMLIMRNFFQSSVPGELVEAAYVDGCTNVGTLVRVVLPLSKPILAVLVIFYFVGHWNSYFSALLYLSDQDKYPLQMFIREILIKSQSLGGGEGGMDVSQQTLLYVSLQYAVIVVASLPVLLIYPFMQKFLVKGVMLGSIKG